MSNSNNIKSLQAVSTGYSIAIEATTVATGLQRGELLKLRGPAIFLDRISGNNRKYIAESVHEQVRLLQPRISAKALFGELDHPPVDDLDRLAYVQMKNVSHRIDALWWDDDLKAYMIEATVLDTPNGRILKTICDAGSPLYVSLRSLLDPAKNVQNNGYVDAWMLALITIDFVSQPGFSDAVLEPIATANESMRAVCEALNITSLINNTKRMHKSNKRMYSVIANENVTGEPIEPSKAMTDIVSKAIADIRTKFPSGFSEEDFNAEYNGLFDDCLLGLYSIPAKIALVKLDEQTTATISLDKLAEDKFELSEDADVQYFDSESSPSFSGTERMYKVLEPAAVIATEGWQPSSQFIKTAEDILAYMRTNYENGFKITEFNGIANQIKSNYDADASLSNNDESRCLTIIKDGSIASIGINVNGNIANVDGINEYASVDAMSHDKTNDVDNASNQEALNKQMYQVVDTLQPSEEEEDDTKKATVKTDDKSSEAVKEIAEEAARIFNMPSNRFAGNFAIEHMPAAYKHCWQNASETAKLIIAKRASELNIATESQAIQFFSKLDWTGIERAVAFAPNAQAAVESFAQFNVNKRAFFLESFVPRR